MWRMVFVGAALIAAVTFLCPAAYAGAAPYVVLTPVGPPTVHGHAPNRVPVMSRYRAPYAYGWFGAQARRHSDIHYGYRQNYIEWSLR